MDKKLVAKMDRVLLPFLTLLFLSASTSYEAAFRRRVPLADRSSLYVLVVSFLDRVNIGVAKLAGLNEELGLNSLQVSRKDHI
jgi:hypothetical protein